MAQIGNAVKTNSEIASVVAFSPYQLLGITEDARRGFVRKAAAVFVPKAAAQADEASGLVEVAEKYTKIIRGAHLSFYNLAVTEQAKSRVEV